MVTQVNIKRMTQDVVTKTVTAPDPVTKVPKDFSYQTYEWTTKKTKTLYFPDAITAVKAVQSMTNIKGDVRYQIDMVEIPSTTEKVLSGNSLYTFVCDKCSEIFLDIEIAKAVSSKVTEFKCTKCNQVLATHHKVINQ